MDTSAADIQALLARVQQGDQAAANEMFELYQRRLIGLARSKLDKRVRHLVDPEDVVQSVFRKYFQRQQAGQLEVKDWDHLWRLLAQITAFKCLNVHAHCMGPKHNVNLEVPGLGSGENNMASWQALAREPTPEQAAVLTDLVERHLAELPERERRIVRLHLEGQDSYAIGEAIGRAERTVRRTLDKFRRRVEEAALQPSSIFTDARA